MLPPSSTLRPAAFSILANEGRRCRFAVRTGHGNNVAGAVLKKKLDFAGDERPGLPGRLQLGAEILVPRRAHDDVLAREAVGIMFAEAEADVQAAQRTGIIAEGGEVGFLVAQRDLRAERGELFDALFVADAAPMKATFLPCTSARSCSIGSMGFPFPAGRSPPNALFFLPIV